VGEKEPDQRFIKSILIDYSKCTDVAFKIEFIPVR